MQRIREESNALVSILKPNSPFPTQNAQPFNQAQPPERILLIKADEHKPIVDAIGKVTTILLDAARSRHSSSASNTHEVTTTSLRVLVHHTLVGAIIGRGGEVIKNTSVSSGARISVSNQPLPNSTDKAITVTGTPQAIQAAAQIILQQIDENPLRANVRSFPYHPIATVFPPQAAATPFSVLLGQPNQNLPAVTQKIAIPSNASGAIIGKGGSVIRDLRLQSQCQISIADPDSSNAAERIVTLTGTVAGIHVAMQLIRVAVESVTQRQGQGQPPLQSHDHANSNHANANHHDNSQRKPRKQYQNANNRDHEQSHQ